MVLYTIVLKSQSGFVQNMGIRLTKISKLKYSYPRPYLTNATFQLPGLYPGYRMSVSATFFFLSSPLGFCSS